MLHNPNFPKYLVDEYLKLSDSPLSKFGGRNQEYALHILFRCQGNIWVYNLHSIFLCLKKKTAFTFDMYMLQLERQISYYVKYQENFSYYVQSTPLNRVTVSSDQPLNRATFGRTGISLTQLIANTKYFRLIGFSA